MNEVILLFGQLALALAGFAACVLLLVVIVSGLSFVVRKAKELQRL
jgi:hypothetical protein